jgi:hypothetical protein
MSKSKRARRRTVRVTVRKASVRKFIPLHKSGKSKQDYVLRLLRGANGATIENVMEATGWQPHSVRAFFAARAHLPRCWRHGAHRERCLVRQLIVRRRSEKIRQRSNIARKASP